MYNHFLQTLYVHWWLTSDMSGLLAIPGISDCKILSSDSNWQFSCMFEQTIIVLWRLLLKSNNMGDGQWGRLRWWRWGWPRGAEFSSGILGFLCYVCSLWRCWIDWKNNVKEVLTVALERKKERKKKERRKERRKK